MGLPGGTKLGPYEIDALLGAGGMGEVYRARDTRLDRTVAIKVLASAFTADSVVKARFEREARTISQITHPYICTLHDIGSHDGIDFLVMEYLDGENLAQRLKKGPMPLDQALNVAVQVADALDKAHRAGVVHRDLKPGNIMLTRSGAKLLDFGLAKPTGLVVVSSTDSPPLLSTAVTIGSANSQMSPLTSAGSILGTVQYMSPEQIEGRETDARSDIFALGAVLYEMVTGRRAFEGKSEISVASAILEKEPQPITAIQRTAPAALDRVIRTCLAKDREQRYQSAFDVKLELRWIAEAGEDINRRAATTKRWREWLAWGLVAAFLAAAIVATYSRTPAPPAPRLMATVVPPAGVFPNTLGRNGPPQLSPDGSRVAFIGCKTESESQSFAGGSGLCSIWLRSLGSIDGHEVAGTNGGYFPFWSPDGRDLAFFADGKLKRVPAGGGPVQVICDAQDARGGSWGRSGEIIFSATRGSPIFRVAAAGGIPEPVTRSAPPSNLSDVGSHRWPKFLPDGEHFLYVNSPNGACSDQNELRFASLDGKQDVSVMRTCSSADFAAGHLIYWRDSNLVAQPFDASRGVLTGSSNVLAEHVAFDSLFSFGEFSVSGDDKLVYITGEGVMGAQLAWHDRTGKVLGTIGEDDQYTSVAISPSGSSVVAVTSRMKKNIRVMDARGSRTLVTSNSIGGGFPTWSADGRQIYFTSRTNGPYNIRMKAADGSGDEQPLVTFEKGFGAAFLAASTDGKYLAYVGSDPITKLDIYTVPLSGERKPLPFLHSSANESAPVFSPDGKWLAYESDQSGRNEVYITRFPGAGAQYQVSTMAGERPIWRRDGKEIFYREGLRLMAVEVTTHGGAIQLGTPQALFELAVRNLNGRWYDVSPDGRFLTNTAARRTHAQNFELVVNWPAQLKD